MEPLDNSKTKALSWGAPASMPAPYNSQTQDVKSQQNPFNNDRSYQPGPSPNPNHFQRPSPYHKNHNRGRGTGGIDSTFNNHRNHNDSSSFQNQAQSFSPRNPFFNQGQNFSSDNPFQSKGSNFNPSNPFQNKGQFNSPKPHSPMRPNFQSSPQVSTSSYGNHSFSPRTPNVFNTPSPRGFRYQRNNADSSKRFGQRNNSMNNPGGSSNIQDYIHPSMLEDPWKDLPPKLVHVSY